MSGPSTIDRETLRKRLDWQETFGQVFGWTVGIGLLIEYGQEIIDCVVKRQLPSWPLIGGLLVTLGVFGEVWFSRLALRTAETISDRADSDVALAKQSAAEAYERAKAHDVQIAEANARAAEAHRLAQTADLERRKLEAQIAPRSISLERQQAIARGLTQFAGRRVILTTYSLDAEGALLGQQLAAMFHAAGIEVTDNTASLMVFGGFVTGVHINGAEDNLTVALRTLLSTLGGLLVAPVGTMQAVPPGPPGVINVLVGVKPVPIIARPVTPPQT